MDLSNNTFIPFDTKNSEVKLLSFYHASTVRSIWVLPSNIQNAVLDITRDNILFYRKGNDVLLTEKQTYAFNSLNIILKDYYIEQNQWSNVSLYSYNNSIKGIIDLYNIEVSAISYQNLHDSVIQEYTIDTTKESQEIQHNQERLGVVIFQNMSFDRLEVTARNNNLVLLDSIDNNKEILIIKNWYKHNKYKSVMFEFSSGLEPDRIYISDRIEKKINFNNKLSKEILNIGNNVVKSVISYLILTCDQQATLAQRLTYSFLKASSSDLSLEEIKQNINTTISARALVLLAAKAYNKLSLKYDIEKKNILQNSCFSTVLLPLKIQEIIQYVDSTDLNQIEQFIHKNTHEIHSITTSNIPLLNDSHKHRHHHGEHVAHHRGRRDIDHAWEIAAAAQDDHNDDLIDLRDDILEVSRDSSLTPWGYNIVNWIRNNILLTFKDIDPLGSVKNLWNVYNDNTNTTIYDLDVSDNLGYRDSKNQDAVVDKFIMMQKINSKISELEERKIEVTKLLRALYQKLNSAEKELHKYRQDQYEYEEELSNTLLTLIKRKLDIQKQEVDTAKINNDVEKIKQSIQDNELLNCHYTREIQMLKKEQWGDTITDIYYEDRIKYLKEQIKSCEEEDIRLNNALQALEAQKTEDYTESSLVKERIFQLVRPLNIEEAKILQEEDELAIMHKNQQEQQQEIYHIKDQIELQKSLIENLRCELNVLNQELAMLNVEDNNLSLHYELPYWNGSLEKNVEVDYDIADQLPLSISGSHHINVGNLSNLFIGNDTDKNQVLDDSLCDFQGTVSLWNLLMRKKYGVHYNHQHDIIQGKEINTEYAHILAYNAYYNTSKENLEYNLGSIGSIAQYDDKMCNL